MQHKVKLTVIDKKLYPELQRQYCTDPNVGACPCYNVGDEFVFERYGTADDFWHVGLNTLKQSVNASDQVAGGTAFPHCSEAWDAVARCVYGIAGRRHNARLDERRESDDCLLFGRHKTSYFQD